MKVENRSFSLFLSAPEGTKMMFCTDRRITSDFPEQVTANVIGLCWVSRDDPATVSCLLYFHDTPL